MSDNICDLLQYVAEKQGKHKQGSLITAAICRTAIERIRELEAQIKGITPLVYPILDTEST